MDPRAITRLFGLLTLIAALSLPAVAQTTDPGAETGLDAPARAGTPDADSSGSALVDANPDSLTLPEPSLHEPALHEPAPRSPAEDERADEHSPGPDAARSEPGAEDGEPGPDAVVDGVSLGVLVVPTLPGAPARTDDVAGGRFTLLDRGATAPAGARVPRRADDGAPATDDAARTGDEPARLREGLSRLDDSSVRPAPAIDLRVDERWPAAARSSGGVIADRQVIAYYGHPFSRFMGALGENELPVMAELLRARAASYDEVNGEIGVAPAFHIIYGTVYEDASVGILREEKLVEYIEFAREHDILVFLDHQIGNGTVEAAVRRMLPYLRYEHVHLAFDPEWATDRPGQVIGSVRAEEINQAQLMIQRYLEEHNLPGPRMLVVHQFNWRMIENRERVRADFPLVQLIHHADGFGSPPDKVASWEFNNLARNIPLKGFKLFYPKNWRDGGYDDPLMTPAEVMRLEPVPVYIQYQ